MISATDSFIQYLSTSLANNPPVAWVRTTSLDAATSELQMNKLNVEILSVAEAGSMESPLISLDILASDERQGMLWVKRVRDLLVERQYIPELDYSTTPATPTTVGKSVFWDGDDVTFDKVRTSPKLVHYNATFLLKHAR